MTTTVEGFIDVEVVIPIDELILHRMNGRDTEDLIMRKLKDEAERVCDEHRAQLRTETTPEIVTKEAIEPMTGEKVLLVATRWKVDGPEELFRRRG
jgi:hypothetical protein